MTLANLIFSCMKNEGPFLLEWLSYHRALGFDDAFVFTNDCEDGSDQMAEALAAKGLIRHVKNGDHQKRGPQWTALNSPELRKALKTADWAIHLDLDEFLNIKTATGKLADLTTKIGDADAISIPWRFFGNNGRFQFNDQPIIQQFTRCGPYPIMFPRQTLMFKTLFRPSDRLDRAGVHAPRLSKDTHLDQIIWLNGDGHQVNPQFDPKNPVLHGTNAGNGLAQINHYALRSMQSFLIKSQRGLPNHGRVPVDLSYWVRRNFNDLEDKSLADRPQLNEFQDDPELMALHRQSCDWHRSKIAEIMATPEGIEFYTALAVTGHTIVPDQAKIAQLYQSLGAVFGKKT